MRPRRTGMHVALGIGAILALTLGGCVTRVPPAPLAPPPERGSSPPTPSDDLRTPIVDGPAILPGWAGEDHRQALIAYVSGCHLSRDAMGADTCRRAREVVRDDPTATQARLFLERNFRVVEARTPDGRPGLLTAYFAPEYAARRRPDAIFDTPVRPRPAGWTRGTTGPDRAAIEARPAPDALAWMRAEDLFFMQIQGSAYLTFDDGARVRASYAADNGRPFVGIARPMSERGLLARDGTSGEAIRGWLAANRGARARAITDLNPRYIYFSLAADDGGHPPGAAGVALTPRRGIAVDPAHWTYGDLVWIEADAGNLRGARSGYSGLVMALDTGSAIRGPVRADFYMGRGEAAGAEAGTVRHPLRMWRLVPR